MWSCKLIIVIVKSILSWSSYLRTWLAYCDCEIHNQNTKLLCATPMLQLHGVKGHAIVYEESLETEGRHSYSEVESLADLIT